MHAQHAAAPPLIVPTAMPPTDPPARRRRYRDRDGTALALCLSDKTYSLLALGSPMCFPSPTTPSTLFPNNRGPELFYNSLDVAVSTARGRGDALAPMHGPSIVQADRAG